jgi:hypothetical protein
VQGDEAAHHREAEARAGLAALARRGGAVERAAEMRQLARQDADPGVADAQREPVALAAGLDRHEAARGGELHGV